MLSAMLLLAITLGVLSLALAFTFWGSRWGSTADERAARMPGDAYLEGGSRVRVVMTRAVSIAASPDRVWPWLAQMGRGAGWYSYDRLDNGGRSSARHIVSWIPAPRRGDVAAIGYLRDMSEGTTLTWWAPRVRFFGARADAVADISVRAHGTGSRLVVRWSARADGILARPALWVFRFIDSVMSIRQLRGIRQRAQDCGRRAVDPDRPENGAHDQFQLYEVVYASGERAGQRGSEDSERWRQAAIADGVLQDPA